MAVCTGTCRQLHVFLVTVVMNFSIDTSFFVLFKMALSMSRLAVSTDITTFIAV